jgi:hypothetical protein
VDNVVPIVMEEEVTIGRVEQADSRWNRQTRGNETVRQVPSSKWCDTLLVLLSTITSTFFTVTISLCEGTCRARFARTYEAQTDKNVQNNCIALTDTII